MQKISDSLSYLQYYNIIKVYVRWRESNKIRQRYRQR